MKVGDAWLVSLAVATAAGAWFGTLGEATPAFGAVQIPLAVAVALAVGALTWRRPAAVCLAAAVLAACLAQRSMNGLVGPEQPEQIQAEVTLVRDPRPTPGGGVRADARLNGRRLALEAHRSSAAALRNRLAGERVIVVGEIQPPGPYEELVPHRHLSGRLRVDTVVGWYEGHGVTRVANGVRRTLADGTGSLSERQQSLLSGLILGDSRHQPSDLTAAFRNAGLAHLLAVSGQNVAFLLTAVSPVLSRLRLAPRLVVTMLVLATFVLITRGEPSVLRATAMAAIGAYSAATGRPSSGLRRLALAVTGVLLCDPLLVSSLGFQLSVAGAAGIIVGATPIADRLPGPRWLRLPAAVTIAAEIGVAPVLVATLGSVPVVSLPANLLAAPAAGPAKLWGLTGGLAAGLVGDPLATVLHVPSRLFLVWLDQVATVLAGLELGELRAAHVAMLAVAWGAIAAARRVGHSLGAAIGATGLVVGVVTLGCVVMASVGAEVEDGLVEIGPGMELWRGRGAAVVVIDGRASEDWLLPELRRHGIRRIDVLIVRTSANRAIAVANRVLEQWPSAAVLAPTEVAEPGAGRIDGAITPPPGSFDLGGLSLSFEVQIDRLEPAITIVEAAPGEAMTSRATALERHRAAVRSM